MPEVVEEVLEKKLLSFWSFYFFAAKMKILGLKKVRGRWKEQKQSPGSADHSTAQQQHEQWENKERTDNSGTDGGRQDRDSHQQALHGAVRHQNRHCPGAPGQTPSAVSQVPRRHRGMCR